MVRVRPAFPQVCGSHRVDTRQCGPGHTRIVLATPAKTGFWIFSELFSGAVFSSSRGSWDRVNFLDIFASLGEIAILEVANVEHALSES
jgi:hypothetical protein